MDFESFSSYLASADNAALYDQAIAQLRRRPGPGGNQLRLAADTADALLAADAEPSVQQQQSGRVDCAKAKETSQSSVVQDMSLSLCHYFISSSHNTYLVGGQWKGDSTVEGYVRALQQGARSVELDCWDGPNLTPQITHGRTLTSKVAFVDVIQAIDRYAFVASPYPLILSLEVHNDVAQQDVMAQILRDVLREKLLVKCLDQHAGTAKGELPSPERLRGKILIKAKNLFVSEAEKERAEASGDGKAEAWHAAQDGYSASDDATGSDDGSFSAHLRTSSSSTSGSGLTPTLPARQNNSSEGKASHGKKVLMSTALASLLIYTVGIKSRGINKKEVYAPEHMISLSERTALKYVRSAPDDLIKHNRSHLSRIYPSMSSLARLHASANFLPHHVWALGCQLVALNWQTADLGMELNQAMFARNGRCGYVVKPEALRSREHLVKTQNSARVRLVLDIDVISAQQLPRSREASRELSGTGAGSGGGSSGGDGKDLDDESDVISPSVSVSLIAPQSWGPQPATTARVTTPDTRSSPQHQRRSSSAASNTSSPSSSGFAAVLGLGLGGSQAKMEREHSRTSSTGGGMGGESLLQSTTNSLRRSISNSSTFSTSSSSSNVLGGNSNASASSTGTATAPNSGTARLTTDVVRKNGFNPVWMNRLSVPIEVPGDIASYAARPMARRNSSSQSPVLNHEGSEAAAPTVTAATLSPASAGSATGTAVAEAESTTDGPAREEWRSMTRGLLDVCFLRFQVNAHELEDSGIGSTASPSSSSASSFAPVSSPRTPHLQQQTSTLYPSTSSSTPIASCVVPLGNLQEGYRHLPLFDCHLSPHLFSTLFVRIRFRYVGIAGPMTPGDD